MRGKHREKLEKDGEADESGADNGPGMPVDPGHHLRGYKGSAFGPLDQDEIGDQGQGQPAPKPAVTAQTPDIIKGEHHAGGKLGQHPAGKGDPHGKQDTRDNGKGFARVDVIRQSHQALAALGDLDNGYGNGGTQQFKHNGNGGGSGQAEGVEQVQQQNVGDHDRQKNGDQFGHDEKLGMKDAFSSHFHHSAGKGDADQYAQAGHYHDGMPGGHSGTHGRVEEINGVVAHTHH